MIDQTYRFRGQSVRYGVRGAGPGLVFVHGTPFSSHVWHRIAPQFQDSHTVYCFDLLGYGQSDKAENQDVSLGIQNQVLDELLAYWGLSRPDVIAHDFGGATALRTHLLNGRQYRSLTLIDPVALSPWGSPFVEHVRQHEAAFRGMPPYIHEAIVPAYIRGAVQRCLPESELAPYVAPWLGAVGQAAFYRQIAQMDQKYTDEVAPLYARVRCPTLILWGEEDRWIPLERGRRLQEVIPGARFRAIRNAGHLVQEDAPEAIVAALREFLAAVDPVLDV
ncbi:MAG TPA: alpha/beta hydrolase [Steroidobacteraceae bacterium]